MLYLNKEDSEILRHTYTLLFNLSCNGKLDEVQEEILKDFRKLLSDSIKYSIRRREKAKKKAQEMRKVDKTYAHTRKEKNNG